MSEKITFKELVEQISRQSRQSRSSTTHFIHELVRIIEKGLKESGSVSISGFGKFELLQSEPRQQAHPVTGEMITVAGRKRVVFKPTKEFREGVNHPFAGVAGRVLEKAADLLDAEETGLLQEEAAEASEPSSASADESMSREKSSEKSGEESRESLDGLLIEHDNPRFTPSPSEKKVSETAEAGSVKPPLVEEPRPVESAPATTGRKEPVIRLGYDEEPDKKDSGNTPSRGGTPAAAAGLHTPEEQTLANEVQKSGSLNWTYTAAVIIALLIFIILFIMYQQNREASESVTERLPDTQNQVEQAETLPPSSDAALPQNGTSSKGTSAGESETGAAATGGPGVQGSGISASGAGSADAGSTHEGSSAATGTTAGQGADTQAASPATTGTTQSEFETVNFTVEPGQSLWTIADTQLGNPYLWPVLYYLNQHKLENPNYLPADADILLPTISDPENLNEFEREQVAQGYFKLYEWNVQFNPEEARYFLWAVGVFSPSLLDQPPSDVIREDLDFARNR